MHKSKAGGSLYVSCNKGECVQDRICSYGSNTIDKGAYCSISVSHESPFKNYILDSTITLSSEENTQGYNNILLSNGEVNMKSINISHSILNCESFYTVAYTSNSNLTLSTFSNNTSTKNNIVYHFEPSDSFEFIILFCNYFENKCDDFIFSYYKDVGTAKSANFVHHELPSLAILG